MSWRWLESGSVNGVPLDLYRASPDGPSAEYMIRVGGLELMNSRWHRSEKELARLGARYLPASAGRPRILIGGLGLGFTLAAFLEELGDRAELLVAEQSADVLRWYQAFFRDRSLGGLDDAGVRFLHRDVREAIATEGPFDLLVLDVDNGPEPVSGETNGELYMADGLALIRASVAARDGAYLLWSAFESPAFEERAQQAGFNVHVEPVNVGLREHRHFIYCCRPV